MICRMTKSVNHQVLPVFAFHVKLVAAIQDPYGMSHGLIPVLHGLP